MREDGPKMTIVVDAIDSSTKWKRRFHEVEEERERKASQPPSTLLRNKKDYHESMDIFNEILEQNF